MPSLTIAARQELCAMPAMVTVARMLELPSWELHQAVIDELAANPALELVADPPNWVAPAGDRLWRVATPVRATDALLADLRASLPAEHHGLAEAVVASLDHHGFLPEPPATLAQTWGVAPSQIEEVLHRLRELGPPGIAARGPRECLLAQLDALEAAGETVSLARAIVAEHLDDLAAGRYRMIARALHVREADVVAAHALIKQQLWPFPLSSDQAENGEGACLPDLIFQPSAAGFSVEVPMCPQRWLGVNPVYAELGTRAATLPAAEREHIRHCLTRARIFLQSLQRRYDTLYRIGAMLAIRQAAWLRYGPAQIAPLSRTQLAQDLGLHVSTVCRAVAGKWALLPNRALAPLDSFFAAAKPLQAALRELIATEPYPLSDEELSQRLAAQGYAVARRTIAKYREQMGIPACHQRARQHQLANGRSAVT